MQYVNAGAFVNDRRPRSKSELRRVLASNPASVTFDPNDAFYDGPALIRGDAIPEHVTVTVCGPNPYTARRWYERVTATPDGPRVS